MSVEHTTSVKTSSSAKKKIVYDFQASIKQKETIRVDDGEDKSHAAHDLCCKEKGIAFLIPIILSSGAFYMSNRSFLWCDYLERELLAFDPRYPFLMTSGQHISMFSFQNAINGGCYNYDYEATNNSSHDMTVDGFLRSARALSLLSSVIGGVLLAMMWLLPCVNIPIFVRIGMTIMLFLNAVFESLVLLLMASPICDTYYAKCHLAFGSYLGIAAAAAWFLASITFGCLTVRRHRSVRRRKAKQHDHETAKTSDGDESKV